MTKEQIIKTLIKPLVKKIFSEKEKKDTMGIVKYFPQVLETLEQLMGPEFKFFVKDIEYIAPKPSTFRVTLINSQYFFLTWYVKTFQAQINGKKYYLLNLQEQERATLEIVELLKYNAPGDIKSEGEEDEFKKFDDYEFPEDKNTDNSSEELEDM